MPERSGFEDFIDTMSLVFLLAAIGGLTVIGFCGLLIWLAFK